MRRGRRVESPDEVLVRALYAEHGPAIRHLAMRKLGDRGDAEDLVQETFLRAWRHPEVLIRQPSAVRAWLVIVARNIAVDRLRHRTVRPREISVADLGADTSTTLTPACAEPDHADRVAASITINEAVAALPPDYRDVLAHVYFGGRSIEETAAALQLRPGTVKSRTHYAIAALRKKLGRGDLQ